MHGTHNNNQSVVCPFPGTYIYIHIGSYYSLEYNSTILLSCRKIFQWFMFVLFIYNTIIGLASALFRVLISATMGLLLMLRLDRVILMKGFEPFDIGTTYIQHTYMLYCLARKCWVNPMQFQVYSTYKIEVSRQNDIALEKIWLWERNIH